jgi:hypothetical protein
MDRSTLAKEFLVRVPNACASMRRCGADNAGIVAQRVGQPPRLKNCTAFSCFSAAARVPKVPRLRRLPVFGFFLR